MEAISQTSQTKMWLGSHYALRFLSPKFYFILLFFNFQSSKAVSLLNIQHILNIKQMLIQTIVFHLNPDLPEWFDPMWDNKANFQA